MNIRSKTTILVVSALMLVGVGVAVLLREIGTQELNIPQIPSRASASTVSSPGISGRPVRLQIERLGSSFEVRTGEYDSAKQTWTLDTQHVFWANLSMPANSERGTTLLYAHAEPDLFGKLPELQISDVVTVTTDSGYTLRYKLVGGQTVNPDDSAFLLERTGAPRLMLQTCTGMWWEKRQLFAFDLVEARKI